MQVVVNNKTYNVPDGSSINIVNNTIYVNGEKYEGGTEEKKFEIVVTGGVANIKVERGNVIVHGNVEGTVDAGGSVTCGDVDAGGSVRCGNVGGDVDAGGSVRKN